MRNNTSVTRSVNAKAILERYGKSYKSNSTKEREFETSLYQRYPEISRGIQLLLRNYWGKTGQAAKQLSLDNNLQLYIHNQPSAATESNRPIPFDFVAVTQDEINLIIMSMPTNKSAGPDKINMRIIRDSLPYILTPLTNIINSSLSSNIYPEAW